MRSWWLVIALLLSLGINVGILASRAWQSRTAASGSPERPPAREVDRLPPFVHRMAAELGLRGQKRDAFVERQRLFIEQTVAARAQVGRLQSELRHEIVAQHPDRAAIDDLLVGLAEAHAELDRAFVNNLLDSRELLEPRQERMFLRLMQRLRQSRADAQERLPDRRWGPRDRPRWEDPRGPRDHPPRDRPRQPGQGRRGPPGSGQERPGQQPADP